MIYVIYAVIEILNKFMMIIKNNSRIVGFFTLFFIWCLLVGNVETPDTNNYLYQYNNLNITAYHSKEIGYIFLIRIGNKLGLEYFQFRMLVLIPCLMLIHITIKKYSGNYHYVYFYYLLYSFFMDAVQINNFIAMSFLIYSMNYLNKGESYSRVKFICCILLASSIHTASLFYLVMLFVNYKDKNRSYLSVLHP